MGRWALIAVVVLAFAGGGLWFWRRNPVPTSPPAPSPVPAPVTPAPAGPVVPADHAQNLTMLQAQLERAPRDPQVHQMLALEYARAADWGPGLAAAEQAVAFAPKDAASYKVLGYLSAQAGLADRAVAAYRAALTLAPDNLQLQVEAGIYFSQVGLHFLAEPPLRAAVAKAPDDALALLGLAAVLVARGHPDEYMTTVRRAYDLQPADPQLLFSLATNLLGMQDLDRAASVIQKLQRVAPDDPAVLLLVGRLRLRQGLSPEQLPAVQALFERALAQNDSLTDARYFLGVCQMQRGDYAAARITLERVVKDVPTYRFAYQQLIQVYDRLGDREHAAIARREFERRSEAQRTAGEILRRAAREATTVDAQLAAGRLALDQDNLQIAEAVFGYALSLNPRAAAARQDLADALRRAGRMKDAERLAAGR